VFKSQRRTLPCSFVGLGYLGDANGRLETLVSYALALLAHEGDIPDIRPPGAFGSFAVIPDTP
jgi:hypothetical protein